MFFKRLKYNIKSKNGSEILQSLMIIAIIGAIGITLAMTFKNQLYNSLGDKIDDSTYDYEIDATLGNLPSKIKNTGIYNGKNKISYNK